MCFISVKKRSVENRTVGYIALMTETMTDSDIKAGQPQVTVHTFTEHVMDTTVLYQVIKMSDSFHLWVGAKPSLENMALAMNTRFEAQPLASHLFGDSSNPTAMSLAQRLAKKTGKQVFVSCNIGYDQLAMPVVEKRIIEEMKQRPEMF
ncbi:proteasome assembly chaperone 4-like [Haliotis rubra]|uniref:proteasome assembly chaperone 4-like n=1 Tax=Haliotis rubra TaxID=36100 RepID=UPI001EE6066D|nr:proteasome assembly chaperone 4-like [Haliotis rubra]